MLLVYILLLQQLHTAFGDEQLQSACNNLEDGLRYIKPTADGEIIPVVCNNGYTIIDASLNVDLISTYFSTFYRWNSSYNGVYGTECTDFSSWRSFWTPSNKDTSFRVASDCLQCKPSNSYSNNVAYYMTNYYHCLNKLGKNRCSLDEIDETVTTLSYDVDDQTVAMCNICDDIARIHKDDGKWRDCYSLQLDADTETDEDHDKCLMPNKLIVRPSVVGDHTMCTCYKPKDDDVKIFKLDLQTDEYPKVSNQYGIRSEDVVIDDKIIFERIEEDDDCDDTVKYYLNNGHFKTGTLKITTCGEYILTEDIIYNFNAPPDDVQNDDNWSPNRYDMNDLYWFPTDAQADDDFGEYPGLNSFRGTYQFGFWTGISIQTDHVIINLNGFEIRMHPQFYLQQRFFSLIALGDRPFVTDQGPANFGRDEFIFPSHVTIQDGTLGLTSHQGLFGNNAQHITIKNLRIKQFDVSGLQCNGCRYGEITNIKIGPQNQNIPTLGRYLHARALIPRLRYFVEEHGDEIIPFGNNNPYKENKSVRELADKLVHHMDMIYFHIINNKEYDDDNDPDWIEASNLFLNPNGWMDGGSSYGMILNGVGTAVIGIGRRKLYTKNMHIEDIEIFGIGVSPKEKFWKHDVKPGANTILRGFFFDTIDWKYITNKNDNRYIGDVYTDLIFAANEVMKEEYCILNTLYVQSVRDWVFSDDDTVLDDTVSQCGSDIQSHDAKGAIGLRIDGVQNFMAKNIYIHDIQNWGELGNQDECGGYEVVQFLKGAIYKEIEPGYTGTRSQGIIIAFAKGEIHNVEIKNIESHYGSATGISIYKGTTIGGMSDISINSVVAGKLITTDELNNLESPNYTPYTCSIQIDVNNDFPDIYPVLIDGVEEQDIFGTNVIGYDICSESERIGRMNDDSKMVEDQILIDNNNNNDTVTILVYNNFYYYLIFIVLLLIFGIYRCCFAASSSSSSQKNKKLLASSTANYGSLSE